jgi:Flp pilus assembly protein TadG
MKFALFAVLLFSVAGAAVAGTSAVSVGKLRLADATADACFANCVSQNASCKRVCPTTFSTPCLGACDSQMQTCTQSCQGR